MKTICIAGKNDIAVRVLLHCLDAYRDMEIVVVCKRNDLGVNGWQKSLMWYAKKNNVRVVKLEAYMTFICDPDGKMTAYSDANPYRSSLAANPFIYYERYQMIKGTLLVMGVSAENFDIIPFLINYPELIFNYALSEAKYSITIYDTWGTEKKNKLESIGCDVDVLWNVQLSEKGISGSDVREYIRDGKEWKPFVPEFVYNYIVSNGLDKRLIRGKVEEVK